MNFTIKKNVIIIIQGWKKIRITQHTRIRCFVDIVFEIQRLLQKLKFNSVAAI